MSGDQDGCEWVSFFWYRPTRVVRDQRPLNGCLSVCVLCNYWKYVETDIILASQPALQLTCKHTHTHPFNDRLSRTTWVSRYQKGKPIWILLKQETVSGSGISWAICKSAPRSRQITMPAPHQSVFYRPGLTAWLFCEGGGGVRFIPARFLYFFVLHSVIFSFLLFGCHFRDEGDTVVWINHYGGARKRKICG